MKKFIFVVFIILLTLIINKELFIGYLNVEGLNKYDVVVRDSKDTIINRRLIDSIQYNIIIKDSIINNLIYNKDEDIKESKHLYDTAAVELFKRLVSE